MEPVLPCPAARAPPALTEHLQEEILVRIGAPADLIRASASCAAFRRLITDPAFLRRYRSLHPPPLLGFLGFNGFAVSFVPADAPHPDAPAGRAFAAAADFSFDHHPARGRSILRPLYDARDGRVLRMFCDIWRGGLVSPEVVVHDPLTREYTLLPPIPDDLLRCPVEEEYMGFHDVFFDPSGGSEEAQFRVMCLVHGFSMAAVFVYSSISGSWTHGTSMVYSALGLNVQPEDYPFISVWHSYAYGSLYWDVSFSNKMIKLDINSMESTTVSLPSHHEHRSTLVVEAGEGRIGMFSFMDDSENLIHGSGNPQPLRYSIWQNESENANAPSVETTIPLPCEYFYHFKGAAQGYIFLQGFGKGHSVRAAVFSVEIKTFKVERVCEPDFGYVSIIPYFGFPPFMSPSRI